MSLFDWLLPKTKDDPLSEEIRKTVEAGEDRLAFCEENYIYQQEEMLQEITEEVHQEVQSILSNAIDVKSTLDEREFDVFLAHNSIDKPSIRHISNKLKDKGLKPWLDEEQILPGTFFQDAIQRAINQVKSAAIFISPNELGKWQLLELRAFISVLVEKDIPVIPVLLPGKSEIPGNLFFLQQLNWVAFSDMEDEEAFKRLIQGITGQYSYDNNW